MHATAERKGWPLLELNQRPSGYEPGALTPELRGRDEIKIVSFARRKCTPMPSPPLPVDVDWSAVQAIVFDLGNVLLDLDNTRYGQGWPHDLAGQATGSGEGVVDEELFYRYDTGQIDSVAFVTALTQAFGLSAKHVTDYWNQILLPGIAPRRYATLEVLRKRYPLYVLSNTNDLHIDWVRQHVAEAGYPDFETRFFEGVFFSQDLHALKPEDVIYAGAEQRIGRPTHELLFIDDKLENVDAARARGWQAIHLAPGRPVEEVLAALLEAAEHRT